MTSPKQLPVIEIAVSPDQPSVVLTAPSVIVAALSPGEGSVPTLVSVENLVGELARFGYVLHDEEQVQMLAGLVNKHFLQRPQADWDDCYLSLRTNPATSEMRPALSTVQDFRVATLQSANEILHERRYGDAVTAHLAEDALVTRVEQIAKTHRSAFERKPFWVPKLIARTALTALVSGLVGVPLDVILRSALGGLFRGEALR